MSANKQDIGTDWSVADAHVLTDADYEEIPELTDVDFARGEIRDRGRALDLEQVTLGVDRDVLAYFRANGDNWQAQINAVLRDAAGLKNPSSRTKLSDSEVCAP